uniref:uncharacterized protein LOC118521862 isoform X2 n=1 Tax=Halichoerus grypus TaxID=9711 RepID=UPI001658FB72|nr:uncharacterized protein LOC118521862 isoform X2 [Halichoerus grypus]
MSSSQSSGGRGSFCTDTSPKQGFLEVFMCRVNLPEWGVRPASQFLKYSTAPSLPILQSVAVARSLFAAKWESFSTNCRFRENTENKMQPSTLHRGGSPKFPDCDAAGLVRPCLLTWAFSALVAHRSPHVEASPVFSPRLKKARQGWENVLAPQAFSGPSFTLLPPVLRFLQSSRNYAEGYQMATQDSAEVHLATMAPP